MTTENILSLPLGSLIAFRERNTQDPMSGEEGILRDEWRIRLIINFKPEDLVNAWGSDWKRRFPFSNHVLEHRYIRRGKEEPWKLFKPTNSYEQALDYVDYPVTALCPVLVDKHKKRQEYLKKQNQKDQKKQEEQEKQLKKEERKNLAQQAFNRLTESKKSGKWATAWNDFCSDENNKNETTKNILLADDDAMNAYYAALEAITVPKKASAIKEFFKHAKRLNLKIPENL